GLGQDGEGAPGGLVAFHRSLGGRGSDAKDATATIEMQATKAWGAADVDKVQNVRQSHVEHRHQRLAAGDDLGLLMDGQQFKCLLDRLWPVVGKRRRFHCLELSSRWMVQAP